MRPLGVGSASALRRAVLTILESEWGKDCEKPVVLIESLLTSPWASLNFVGERITMELRLIGSGHRLAAAERRLSSAANDLELPLAAAFLADLAVKRLAPPGGRAGGQLRLRVEALILDG